MHYNDLRTAGYASLRHHDPTFDVKYRLVSFACRIGGPDRGNGQGIDEFGILQGVRPNWGGEETHGDILNWGMWRVDPQTPSGGTTDKSGGPGGNARPIPGWAQTWASISQSSASYPDPDPNTTQSQTSTTLGVKPARAVNAGTTRDTWKADVRFETKQVPLPPLVDGIPKGVAGITCFGTEEYHQEDLFVPCLPNVLISPHHLGTPTLGTTVYDLLGDDSADTVRKAKLQTLTRVFEIGDPNAPDGVLQALCGPIGKHALAHQMGQTRGGTNSRGAFSDEGDGGGPWPSQTIGLASNAAGGPLQVGSKTDKHGFSFTEDGDCINSLHLSTNAYFYRDTTFDAPLAFADVWDPPSSSGDWWETLLRYDPHSGHGHPKGLRTGLWRWETKVPFRYPKTGGKGEPSDEGGLTRTQPFGSENTFKFASSEPTTKQPSDEPGTMPDGEHVTVTDPATDDQPVIPFNVKAIIGEAGSKGSSDEGGPLDERTGLPGAGVGGVGTVVGDQQIFQQQIFLPNAPVPQPQPQASRFNATNLTPLATLNQIQVPGIGFRAVPRSMGANDQRYSTSWTPNDAEISDALRPVVARWEAVGAENPDGSYQYFDRPGLGRYGSSASGGLYVMPGTTDVLQVNDGTQPLTFPNLTLGLYQTSLGFGTPTRSGLPGSGFNVRLSGSTLVVDTTDGNGATTSTEQIWPATNLSPCFYGDGTDGTVTFDGSTAVAGWTRSGSTYTADRDTYFSGATVNNGVTLVTNAYRVHVNGTLTNHGNINNDGASSSTTGTLNTGKPSNTAAPDSFGGSGGAGAVGGPAATRPAASAGTIRAMPWAILGAVASFGSSGLTFPTGGAGGGAGTTVSGGRGGGCMVIAAKQLITDGTISCDGAPGVADNALGHTAGGGGGGGWIVLAYGPSSAVGGTVHAYGGAGGAAVLGTPGQPGVAGTVVLLC
jgi:hypothetical protein